MHPDQQNDDRRVTYFAATHTRGKREMFGIRAVDRGKHIYVIGKTGMGKSTMLENLAIQDIQNGEGLAFIDPHGSTAEKLLDFVPHDRIKDVVYFAPFDTDYPIGFNVMEDVGYDKRHLVVSGLMGSFKRIWVDAWSARMEYILQNTLLALLEYPDSTLLDVNRMLINKKFRNIVVEQVKDPVVKSFWTEEFAGFTDSYAREATAAIQNKIGQFTANPLVRNIIGQPRSTFDMRKIMDEKKIFIVNLSKGRMGEANASLLGTMLTVKIYLAAMSRADEPAVRMAHLPRCYFYVDEFQSMMNDAFADILSESRKYKLALTLANQYIEQMDEKVRDAVFGNVGTTVCFRVGPFDAEVLKTIFEPTFTAEDLVELGLGEIYLTLMIDGVGSKPFSAATIPPIEAPAISYKDDCITNSRALYARPRAEMEAMIEEKQREFAPPQKEEKRPVREGGFGQKPVDLRMSGQGNAPRLQQPAAHGAPQRREDHNRFDALRTTPDARHAQAHKHEDARRNALRDAIGAARPPQPAAPTPTRVVVKSPLDLMREKQADKDAASAAKSSPQAATLQSQRPVTVPQTHVPSETVQTIRHPHQARASQAAGPKPVRPSEITRPQAPTPETPRPQASESATRHEEPQEVPHDVLVRVLNGHGGHKRDFDDL